MMTSGKVLFAFVLQFASSIQELVLLGGNNPCVVLPGQVVEYECAVANRTATTIYKITWPDSMNCSLGLLNNRFPDPEDECQNHVMAIARANRISGNIYISNISITVPDIASSTPSINVTCSTEDEQLGTATIDIISNGFSFPGKVDLATAPEEGACVFSVASNCTVDDYIHSESTDCSNCSYNGSDFICNAVSPGENCHLSVRAKVDNVTSLGSDQVSCTSNIGGTSADATMPSSSSSNAVAILVGVLVPLVVLVVAAVVTCVIVIFGIRYCIKKKKQKRKANISQFPLQSAETDGQLKEVTPHVESPPDTRPQGSVDELRQEVKVEVNESQEPPTDRSTPARSTPADDREGIQKTDANECGSESPTNSIPQDIQGSVDQLRQQMKEMNQVQSQMQKDFDERVCRVEKKCEDEIHEMKTGMEWKIDELKTVIDTKVQKLDEANQLLAMKESEISKLQQIIDQKDKELAHKDRELDIVVQQLLQAKTVMDMQKEKIRGLQDDLEKLTKKVKDMENNLESRREESKEESDEIEKRKVQEALDTIAKAVWKLTLKGPTQHYGNVSTQQQAEPSLPETNVDKQCAEVKFVEEVSKHQGLKNTPQYKDENSHPTTIEGTRSDHFGHSVSYDNNEESQ